MHPPKMADNRMLPAKSRLGEVCSSQICLVAFVAFAAFDLKPYPRMIVRLLWKVKPRREWRPMRLCKWKWESQTRSCSIFSAQTKVVAEAEKRIRSPLSWSLCWSLIRAERVENYSFCLLVQFQNWSFDLGLISISRRSRARRLKSVLDWSLEAQNDRLQLSEKCEVRFAND